jgi:hypothetical protein
MGNLFGEEPMGQLLIGARRLHLPVFSSAPFFHGFLVVEYGQGLQRVFSADKDKGVLYFAPLVLYEDIFDDEHPDRLGLVLLRSVSDHVDASQLEASFRRTRARIEALDLTYTLITNNCNSVITTLLLQAGIDLPPAPLRFMPGYGQSII